MKKFTNQKHHGFTLIELLVVISIIALLISILLPALKSARTAAHASVSLSNTRQIMVAILTYASDNKDSVPYAYDSVNSAGKVDGPYWSKQLMNMGYLSTENVFWAPDRVPDRRLGFSESYNSDGKYTGYGVFPRGPMPGINYKSNIGTPVLPYRLGTTGGDPSLGHDSEQIVISEGFGWNTFGTGNQFDGMWYVMPSTSSAVQVPTTSMYTRHGGAVRAYLDGHGSGGSAKDIGWIAIDGRNGYWEYSYTSEIAHKAPWFCRYNEYYDKLY